MWGISCKSLWSERCAAVIEKMIAQSRDLNAAETAELSGDSSQHDLLHTDLTVRQFILQVCRARHDSARVAV